MLLIVEGDGDVTATPLLARRVLRDREIYDWDFLRPQKRRDIAHLQARDWYNFKRYLAAAFCEEVPVLWLLDCDEGCALEMAKEIYHIVSLEGVRQPLAFGFWVKEYESLFLADLEAVKKKLGIAQFRDAPPSPEAKRGAKEWLSRQLPTGRIYKETLDQEKITAEVDLGKLRINSRSFRHFENALLWLVKQNTAKLYPLKG